MLNVMLDRYVPIMCSETWLEMVDDWRRRQPTIPTRSAAIRSLVVAALEREGDVTNGAA